MRARGVLIAGNWKMNFGPKAAREFFSELAVKTHAIPSTAFAPARLRATIFAPALTLSAAVEAASALPFPLKIGAQNAHWEKSGAFTGEVSGPMLEELGVRTALAGHSERRQLFGETDEMIRKRATSLLQQGFEVIACIGETRAEREAGQTQAVVETQLRALLVNVSEIRPFLDGRLVIAYEPVWAIGTGLTATPEQAEEAHQIVRKLLWDVGGMEASARTPILYGGSVTPENIAALLACPNIDGALVGGTSLKVAGYAALLEAGARAAG